MNKIARLLGALAGAGAAGALARRAVRARQRSALPQTSGTLRLPGLEAPVEVLRDRWGVPHIYARSTTDLFFAQGVVHAQDRLWQMEFARRLGHGRLAEILGPAALEADCFMRTLGLGRAACAEVSALDEHPEDLALLHRYIAGVNAVIASLPRRRLPFEHGILLTRPAPWRIEDSIVWGKVLSLAMAGNWETELLRAVMVARLGPERTASLEPCYPPDHPVTVSRLAALLAAEPLRGASSLEPYLGRGGDGGGSFGSNAWAVAPERSATGGAVLANDPHLSLVLPSIWYENHLCGGDIHVTGASLPGIPGIVIGHNEHIAWGVTNAGCDVQDLYVERFETGTTRYETPEGWREAEVFHEEIRVRGQLKPKLLDVVVTRHGPIISVIKEEGGPLQVRQGQVTLAPSDLVESEADPAYSYGLALRWTAFDSTPNLHGIMRLARARDWDEFRGALAHWHEPALNMVYADSAGHIGYALAGAIPRRGANPSTVPQRGWLGEGEWEGLIPRAELPCELDPASGLVATANNRVAGDEYPYHLSHEWSNGYRVRRIVELIEEQRRLDVGACAAMQLDLFCRPGYELAQLAAEQLGPLPNATPLERAALELLRGWDGFLTADSAAGAVYEVLLSELQRVVFSDLADLLPVYLGGAANPLFGASATTLARATPLLIDALRRDDALPFGPGVAPGQLLRDALGRAVERLRAALGPDVERWTWGALHQAVLVHTIGEVWPFDRIFNRGPFACGGDADTVCQISFLPIDQYRGKAYGAGYRQICDPQSWDRCCSLVMGGASGHLASPHYDDQIAPWLRGELHPMPWTRRCVEEQVAARLLLAPVEGQ